MCVGIMLSRQFSIHSKAFKQFPWDFVVFRNLDFQTVFHTAERSTSPLCILWRFGIMMSTPSVYTAELSTNSLGDFVVFWNYDFQTVSSHSGAFNQFSGDLVVPWNSDFHIVFYTAEHSTNSLWISWCLRIVISTLFPLTWL